MALRRCPGCGGYTLEDKCFHCGGPTERAGPARYSPEDHYGSYRRALKRQGRGRATKDPDQGPEPEEE
jgi:H/ACA ribonucleoprotein complex subunit 3